MPKPVSFHRWIGHIAEVRDLRLGHVAFGSRNNGIVQHPQVLEAGSAFDRLQHGKIATLARAVVHDRDPRLQRVHQDRCVRLSRAVVCREEQVHFADAVHGTGHLEFEILREIAEIQETKCAEREQHPDRRRIVGCISPPRLDALTQRIRRASGLRSRDQLPVRREHLDVEALERDGVPRLDHNLFRSACRYRGTKRRHHRVGALARFGRRAVGDHVADLHARNQLLHAADVIRVVVRDDEIVDGPDAGLLHRGRNPLRIAQVVCRPAGVDQHRLPGRRDDERGLTAFDVNEIQAQRLRRTDGRRQCHPHRKDHRPADRPRPRVCQLPRPPRAGGCTTSNFLSASRTTPTTSSSSGDAPVFSNDFVWFS